MRFLANENVPLDAVSALRETGHDVLWVRTDSPGSCDEDILSRLREGSIKTRIETSTILIPAEMIIYRNITSRLFPH
jgi:hypothetical protein